MSVILQVKLNGGAPQTGGVIAEDGDVVQLTAASKANWGTPVAEWRICSIPTGFPLPSGWSSDANGYYYQGNTDPPPFTMLQANWGKLGLLLTAKDGVKQVSDKGTSVSIRSASGLRGIFAGETTQYGGNRERWAAEINADLRTVETIMAAYVASQTPVIDTLPAASFHLAPWDPSTITTVSGAADTATDKGGGSLIMSAATVGSRPLLNLVGSDTLNGNPSISFTFNQGSFNNGFRSLTGAPTGPVPQAMACVSKYKSFDATALQTLVCAGAYDAGATSWGAWIAAGGAGADQHGGGYGRACSTTQDADLLPHVHVTTFDGTTVRYYIDGFLVATATPPAPPAANSVDTRNGRIGFYQNAAGTSLAAAAHFDAQWSSTHYSEAVIRKYSRQCAEKFGLWKVGLIYCNGDSITAGNTLADVNNAWPALLATSALVNGGAIEVINAGVGLRTMDQIANLIGIADSTNAAFSGQRRFATNKIGNVEVIWAGTNDNYASSESAANIWADMQARANASIAKGYVPILGTMLRRAGGTGGQETVRTTVNASIRSGPYRFFDLAEHPGFISTASVAQSVVGFSDGIHPTDQANIDVIAPAIAAAINLAIAEEVPT